MELISYSIPKSTKTLTVCPLGDLQWSGDKGPTAQDHLKRHIDRCLELDGYFVGLGDYVDTMSPSNRQRLVAAGLYDTAMQVISEKCRELVEELYEKFLKPTTGRWIGMVHGHHHYPLESGQSTDEMLADLLKTEYLGTSAFIKVNNADLVLYLHHGNGGGKLPGASMNRTYHIQAGLEGADIYMLGHDTKLSSARVSRPFPVWGKKRSEHKLKHRDVWLLSTGSFCKSNIVGHRSHGSPAGDYAEMAGFTPSPLSAPIITVDLTKQHDRIRVSI